MVCRASLARPKIMLSSVESHSVSANKQNSTLSLYINMDSQPTKPDAIKNLRESLSVKKLFHTDIIS